MKSSTAPDNAVSPASESGSVSAEFTELVSGCGLFDLRSRAKVALTGSDRMRWLNGMVTNNVRDLVAGRGVYAFLLNPQGRILADLYAYNRGESLIVDTDQSQLERVLSTFDHYIIMDDVEVTNLDDRLTAIGIAGPESSAVLRSMGLDLPKLEPLQLLDLPWQNTTLTLLRSDNPAVESYELWLSPDTVAPVRTALTNAGAQPISASALELLRIAAGVPRYGQDIHERDLPQETEQQRALNFSKGCYVGQEIVERIRSRGAVHRMFTGFEVRGPLPVPGTKIQAAGKDVGEITSVASLPWAGSEHGVALGYIRREFAMPGKDIRAGDASLAVASLPFAAAFPTPKL